jgi:hypothetical protein
VKITSASTVGAATIVKTMLESAGIPVVLRPLNAALAMLLFPGTGGGPGPVDVLVLADCAPDAKALVAQTQHQDVPRT